MGGPSFTGDLPPDSAGPPVIIVPLTQPQPTITLCTASETMRPGARPSLRQALATARRDKNPHLVIDLSAITSLGSIVASVTATVLVLTCTLAAVAIALVLFLIR
jgi:hypothetical protein